MTIEMGTKRRRSPLQQSTAVIMMVVNDNESVIVHNMGCLIKADATASVVMVCMYSIAL
jgi:hypothetical protein